MLNKKIRRNMFADLVERMTRKQDLVAKRLTPENFEYLWIRDRAYCKSVNGQIVAFGAIWPTTTNWVEIGSCFIDKNSRGHKNEIALEMFHFFYKYRLSFHLNAFTICDNHFSNLFLKHDPNWKIITTDWRGDPHWDKICRLVDPQTGKPLIGESGGEIERPYNPNLRLIYLEREVPWLYQEKNLQVLRRAIAG